LQLNDLQKIFLPLIKNTLGERVFRKKEIYTIKKLKNHEIYVIEENPLGYIKYYRPRLTGRPIEGIKTSLQTLDSLTLIYLIS